MPEASTQVYRCCYECESLYSDTEQEECNECTIATIEQRRNSAIYAKQKEIDKRVLAWFNKPEGKAKDKCYIKIQKEQFELEALRAITTKITTQSPQTHHVINSKVTTQSPPVALIYTT